MKWRLPRTTHRFFSSDSNFLISESSSRSLYSHLANADPSTFALLLRHCSNTRALEQGRLIHSFIAKKGYGGNTFLSNLLIKMYSSCGCLDKAAAVFASIRHKNVFSWNIIVAAYAQAGQLEQAKLCFDQTPEKDIVSWTTMMTSYIQAGHHRQALNLFKAMDLSGIRPDQGAVVNALSACPISQARLILDEIDVKAIELDVVLGTSIVGVYGKLAEIENAIDVFHRMRQRNAVSWTVMVEAFVIDGLLIRARDLFDKMPEWSTASWVVIISSYSRVGNLTLAKTLLERMPQQNVAAWSVVVAAFAHSGDFLQGLILFQRMDLEGVGPDKVTLVNILDASAKSGALTAARIIEAGIAGTEFMEDETIVTNLINVYGKCSRVDHAVELFEAVFALHSVILWSAAMAALAQNDRVYESIELFHCLLLYGMEPTRITTSIVLFACSHGGLLRRGRDLFQSMQSDHFLVPDADHFVSMIDLLARSGWLELAFDLVSTMPFVPDDVAWTSLLNASKLYGEWRLAVGAAEKLVELGDDESAPYVLLAGAWRSQQQEHDRSNPSSLELRRKTRFC